MRKIISVTLLALAAAVAVSVRADSLPDITADIAADTTAVAEAVVAVEPVASEPLSVPDVEIDAFEAAEQSGSLFSMAGFKPDIYDYPYSRTRSVPNWKHLWVNTSVLMGAGVATMVILEALPQESTAWNKRANTKVPMFKRWWKHVKEGPVWDGDNAIFNYVLHPYAGAAYYMGARSCGFNCLGSFLYSFCISTFFWEYGFEAFNEIPSVQDLIITPVVGSLLGEGFYLVKRHIVSKGYRLFGSRILGYIAAFLVDPLNECIGYFRGDQRKKHFKVGERSSIQTSSWIGSSKFGGLQGGVTVKYVF